MTLPLALMRHALRRWLLCCYVDSSSPHAASGIESIADAVTHTKFMGTDLASDEVVLMKILQVRGLAPSAASHKNNISCAWLRTGTNAPMSPWRAAYCC